MTTKYQSEASINRVLAQLQLAGAAISQEQTEEQESSFEMMIREALASENEAIRIYKELASKSNAIGSTMLEKAFNELAADEQVHVGNLNSLLTLLCPEAVQNEELGKVEEVKAQAEV